MKGPSIIALDLEGTLISTAVSQIPRPGLTRFISFCLRRFDRVTIFTAVRHERVESIIALLVAENVLPLEFAERWEFVNWDGPVKDLAFIQNADPSDCVLVDDLEQYIRTDQADRWIRVEAFTGREEKDSELYRVEQLLQAWLDKGTRGSLAVQQDDEV